MQQTPPGFCVAVKSSRYLTHIKRLADMQRGVQRLIEPLQPLVEVGRMGARWGGSCRRGNSSQSELAEWPERLGGWARDVDVYAYFNNDREQFALPPRHAR